MKEKELVAAQPVLEAMAQLAKRKGPVPRDELQRLRTELRQKLVTLRAELGAFVTERDAYLAIFPLVVHLDEMVQTALVEPGVPWAMLQKEFFDTDRGGDLFYQTLDDVLASPRSPSFVLQLYAFSLRLGFHGRHGADPDRVAAYLAALTKKLPAPPAAESAKDARAEEVGRVKLGGSPLWYYAGAALIAITVYLVVHSFASGDVDAWRRQTSTATAPAR
jgi:type IV/VI secretion system ImpK/VasF family protein